jgi:uncharacterized protein YbjT (DUF2867 family)
MADKKIIAVMGATGAQGSGLARAILKDKNSEFAVKAVTRNTSTDKAKELAKLGADVVEADIDDIQSLKKVFAGCYGAFCVTFYWAHLSPEKELAEAKGMAEAAKAAGLKHVIWSTLEDTRKWIPLDDDRMPTLQGKYKVPHYDAKGEANKFFEQAGVPTTYLNTSFYWDNFIYFGSGPQKDEGENYALVFPMGNKKLPAIASEDIGKCAYGVFKRGSEFIGKSLYISGENLTIKQMADAMTKALGVKVSYKEVSPEVFRSFGFPGADDLGNMFQFKRDFEDYYSGVRDTEFARSLNPELLSFKDWLAKYGSKIPLK